MQAKVVGKSSYAVHFAGYDEYVPMVDKAVDAEWKKHVSLQRSQSSKGCPYEFNFSFSSSLLFYLFIYIIYLLYEFVYRPFLITVKWSVIVTV